MLIDDVVGVQIAVDRAVTGRLSYWTPRENTIAFATLAAPASTNLTTIAPTSVVDIQRSSFRIQFPVEFVNFEACANHRVQLFTLQFRVRDGYDGTVGQDFESRIARVGMRGK